MTLWLAVAVVVLGLMASAGAWAGLRSARRRRARATLDPDELGEVIQRAVASSEPVARAIISVVDDVLRTLAAQPLPGEPDDPADGGEGGEQHAPWVIARDLRDGVTEALAHVRSDCERSTESFKLVLLGRTGAGKSSLIEAITGGDGRRISGGEMDHTKVASSQSWGHCQLYDTPGTNGWSESEELRSQARDAVLAADVVLLCFDSVNSQAEEFATMAEWVLDYGKPAFVVLNCRGDWGNRDLVDDAARRGKMSTNVATSAGRIRDVLAGYGLADVPLVAENAWLAVAGLTQDPYLGQNPKAIQRIRRKVARADLVAWSNLLLVKSLLSEALRLDAAGLRLGALVNRAAAAVEQAAHLIDAAVVTPANEYAAKIEEGIETMLALFGVPQVAQGPEGDHQRLLSSLGHLETLRGEPFEAPMLGSAAQFARSKIGARLTVLRGEARRRAENLIDDAFAKGHEVSPRTFSREVFRESEMQKASASALDELSAYLREQVSLADEFYQAELAPLALTGTGVGGDAGRWLRKVGVAGAAAALAGIAVVNFYNPLGWAAAAAGVAVSLLQRWASRIARRQREQALVRSRAGAFRSVDQAFDDLTRQIEAEFDVFLSNAAVEALSQPVRQATTLRELATRTSTWQRVLDQALADLPVAARDPQSVVRRAADTLQRRATDNGGSPADLWLGESWLTDETGLKHDDTRPRAVRPWTGYDLGRDDVVGKILAAWNGLNGVPRPGSGRAWLAEARERLDGDEAARPALDELEALASEEAPRIVLCGPYNAGKSALIRRLLVQAGQPVPASLESSAAPQTQVATAYPWQGLSLVDTPGFQSGAESHAEITRRALADAAYVIYVVTPHLITADRADVALLLQGDPDGHTPPKGARLLFLLNRIDELGSNPAYAPHEFRRVVRIKERALSDMLSVIAEGPIGEQRILALAAAPSQETGDAPDAYARYESWDGVREFRRELARLRPQLLANATDVSLLSGGIHRLDRLLSDARADAEATSRALERTDRAMRSVDSAVDQGEALADDMGDRFRRMAEDFPQNKFQEVLAAPSAQIRADRALALQSWPTHPEFAAEYDRWTGQLSAQHSSWLSGTRRTLAREMGPKLAVALPTAGLLATAFEHWTVPAAQEVVNQAVSAGLGFAQAMTQLDDQALERLFDAVGFALPPEQVLEMTDLLADIALAVPLVRELRLVHALRQEHARDRESDEQRRRTVKELRASSAEWARQTLTRLHDRRAPLGLLRAHIEELRELRTTIADEYERLRSAGACLERRIAGYEALIGRANHLMGAS